MIRIKTIELSGRMVVRQARSRTGEPVLFFFGEFVGPQPGLIRAEKGEDIVVAFKTTGHAIQAVNDSSWNQSPEDLLEQGIPAIPKST